MSPRSVYVHVGLPKTGTTYLQSALWLNQERLRHAGVLVPGTQQAFHKRAVWDLLGRRARGVRDRRLAGTWKALVDEVNQSSADMVVVSEEFLVYARPRHVRKLIEAFAPADLHVVITARDLGRMIGSAWQHELTKGHTWTWSDFVAAVRDPSTGPATAGIGFWMRYDLVKVLTTWTAHVPPARVHVVVVPPRGAAPTELLDRFAQAIDASQVPLEAPANEVNTAVGAAEAEVLRRLNTALDERLNEHQYVAAVKRTVLAALAARTASARIRLPEAEHGWAAARAQDWIDHLRSRPYDVAGDLDDLLPRRPADDQARDPDEVDEADISAAAIQALTASVEDHAAVWWQTRGRRRASRAVDRPAHHRLGSFVRTLGYHLKVGTFRLADKSPLLARAANSYLRRTSDNP